MPDDYDANQRLEYEDAVNTTGPEADDEAAAGSDGWHRDDTRYGNCSAVWWHDNGDELLVHPDADQYEVLKKSSSSGTLRRLRPFDSPDEAEAFVEGMLVNLE